MGEGLGNGTIQPTRQLRAEHRVGTEVTPVALGPLAVPSWPVTISDPLHSLDALISAAGTAALIVAAGPSGASIGAGKEPHAHSVPSISVLNGFCKRWGPATNVAFAQGLWEVRCCSPAKELPSPADLPPASPPVPPDHCLRGCAWRMGGLLLQT